MLLASIISARACAFASRDASVTTAGMSASQRYKLNRRSAFARPSAEMSPTTQLATLPLQVPSARLARSAFQRVQVASVVRVPLLPPVPGPVPPDPVVPAVPVVPPRPAAAAPAARARAGATGFGRAGGPGPCCPGRCHSRRSRSRPYRCPRRRSFPRRSPRCRPYPSWFPPSRRRPHPCRSARRLRWSHTRTPPAGQRRPPLAQRRSARIGPCPINDRGSPDPRANGLRGNQENP